MSSMDRLAKMPTTNRAPATVEDPGHREEPVHHPVVAVQLHRYPRGLEAMRVALALIAQRVVFGGDDESRWQTAQIWCEQRGNQRVRTILRSVQIVLPVPVD